MSRTVTRRAPQSGWNRFPLWLILAMGLVMAVNVRFIVLALTTFPGEATHDDFDTSNQYDRILSQKDRQTALGWSLRVDGSGAAPVLMLSGKDGLPMAGASMAGVARRPMGTDADVAVALNDLGMGRYGLATALQPGQWDLLLSVKTGSADLHMTRRVLVK